MEEATPLVTAQRGAALAKRAKGRGKRAGEDASACDGVRAGVPGGSALLSEGARRRATARVLVCGRATPFGAERRESILVSC